MSELQPKSERVSQVVQKFEQAWKQDGRPQLAQHLAGDGEMRIEALWELVSADLDFRIKANEVARVEDYLREYPELLKDGYQERLSDFISLEYRLRSRREPELDPGEYKLRFPNQDCGFIGNEFSDLNAEPGIAMGNNRFRLVCPLAEGGLGKIWQGYDSELGREVAIKEIKQRFADDELARRRFTNEARITSHLEHPGIVPIHGMGTFPDGRPYYAMRFVRGKSFAEAIQKAHEKTNSEFDFELRRLLARFVAVCETISYAHDNGILHRDIKPSNIMLGDHGETFVLDWGLAKRIGAEDDSAEFVGSALPEDVLDMSTVDGCTIGSPSFMSPEQARGEHATLTPSADIFSLGATLFSMLTDKRPIAGKTPEVVLEKARIGEAADLSATRHEVPKTLKVICRKAMSQRPCDRYDTVKQLAEDIERFMADEPTIASPDTSSRYMMRLVRRNRLAVMIASTAAAVLIATALISGTMIYAKSREAKVITDYIVETIQQTDLNETDPMEFGEALLSKLSDGAKSKLANMPLHRARCANAFAHSFASYGDNKEALSAAELSYQLYRQELGDLAIETLDAERLYGAALLNRTDIEQGIPHLQHAAEHLEMVCDKDDQRLVVARYELARAHHMTEKWDLAVPVFDELLSQDGSGISNPDLRIGAQKLRANIHLRNSEFSAAEQLYRKALESSTEITGKESPQTLYLALALGATFRQQKRLDEAIALLQKTHETALAALGEDHPRTEQALNELAPCLRDQGRYAEALPLSERSLAANQARFGAENIKTTGPRGGLARTLEALGQYDTALEMYQLNYEIVKKKVGPTYRGTLSAKHNIANLQAKLGNFEDSVPALSEVVDCLAETYGTDNPLVLKVRGNFIAAQIASGETEQGVDDLAHLIVAMRKNGNCSSDLQLCLARLARWKNLLGNHDEAKQICEELLGNWQSISLGDELGRSAVELQLAKSLIASPSIASGDISELESMVLMAKEVADRHESIAEPSNVMRAGESALARILLARICMAREEYENAETSLNEARDILDTMALDATYAHRNLELREAYIALYVKWNKPEKAQQFRDKQQHSLTSSE